jgi:hypothetical protein
MLREQAEKERRMVLEVERRKKNPVVLEAKPEPEEEEGRVYQWWCPSSEKGRCSFRRWTVSRDIHWAKQVGIFGYMGVQLRPITPLIKEFLQAIVWFNPKLIESVVQGIPVFFTKEINREMFLLPVAGISKLPVIFQANATEMWCSRIASPDAFLPKEG